MGLNRRLSLTVRLTLLFSLASSAVLLILGFIVGASVERHFEELDLATLHGQLADLRRGLALGHVHGEGGSEGLPTSDGGGGTTSAGGATSASGV